MNASTDYLIEMRVPKDVSNSITAAATHLGLKSQVFDLGFPAVPMPALEPSMEVSLATSRERVILGRASLPDAASGDLRNHSGVVAVYEDGQVSPFGAGNQPPRADEWRVDVGDKPLANRTAPSCECQPTQPQGCLMDVASYLGADDVWQDGINGAGVVIGVVDGGILADGRVDYDRPGLVPRVNAGWPTSDWGTVADWRGHGNMVAIDVLGMAPRASIYDIRISESAGTRARVSDAIAGINWAVEQYRATATPQILCCGWGICQQVNDPMYASNVEHPLTRKVLEAIEEGLLVLFAAGNGGEQCPTRSCGDDFGPGRSIWGVNGHPRVMTVGAAGLDGRKIGYSSQGPAALAEYKPDFCATSQFAGYFVSDSGTSAACAVASGVVALLKQARPSLTQAAVSRILRSTASRIGEQVWDNQLGAGTIQAHAAYNELVGHCPPGHVDSTRFAQLEVENFRLRDMFIELALSRQLTNNSDSRVSRRPKRATAAKLPK